MPKYILDTDTCIYWLKGERGIERKVLGVGLDNVAMTVITECELYYGAYKSARVERNLAVLKALREKVKTLQTTAEVAPLYGRVKTHLERTGQPLDDADLLIAVVVLAAKGILITNNTGHFNRIPGLRIENWR